MPERCCVCYITDTHRSRAYQTVFCQVVKAVAQLADPEAYAKKYDVPVPDADKILLYAMGDGNHSFATAKLHWERTKEKAAVCPCRTSGSAWMTHPVVCSGCLAAYPQRWLDTSSKGANLPLLVCVGGYD